MAFPNPNAWYVDSAQWTAVAAWAATHSYTVGNLVRQLAAPAVNSERVFVCVIAGTSLGSEPSWTITKGATTAEAAGPTWMECTGQPVLNGDISVANSPSWVQSTGVVKGETIYDSSTSSIQIVTTNGTTKSGTQPSFSATAGTTTSDGTATWTSLGLASNFGKFAAPHARLANAFASTWGANGNDYWVGDDHAETQSSAMTLTCPVSNGSPSRVICVDHTTSLPATGSSAQKTTATISTTGASSLTWSVASALYIYGITFNCGSGANAASLIAQNNTGEIIYDSCFLAMVATTSANTIRFNAGSLVRLTNTPVSFAAAGQSLSMTGCYFQWTNTASGVQGTAPTNLFTASGINYISVSGVDLSAVASSDNLINVNINSPSILQITNCKINASVSLTTGNFGNQGSPRTVFINNDSGATNYKYSKQAYQGTITQEIVVVKSGGSSDGTTPQSSKMVTSANSKFYSPLESDPIAVWTDIASAHTVTISVITDNVTLQTTDAWIEVEYLGSASFPVSSFTSCRATNILTAGSAQPTDSTSTWTTTGITTPVKQSLSVSVTPGMKGPILVRVFLAKPSTTMWFDGIAVLS